MALNDALDRVFAIQSGMSAGGHAVARVYDVPDYTDALNVPAWLNTDITWARAQFTGGIALSDYTLRAQLLISTNIPMGYEIARDFLPVVETAFVEDAMLRDLVRQITLVGGSPTTAIIEYNEVDYAGIDLLIGLNMLNELNIL